MIQDILQLLIILIFYLCAEFRKIKYNLYFIVSFNMRNKSICWHLHSRKTQNGKIMPQIKFLHSRKFNGIFLKHFTWWIIFERTYLHFLLFLDTQGISSHSTDPVLQEYWSLSTKGPIQYWWLSARLQYLHCIRNGDTAVLHLAIKIMCDVLSQELAKFWKCKIGVSSFPITLKFGLPNFKVMVPNFKAIKAF